MDESTIPDEPDTDEGQRQAIFRAVVEAQDAGASVAQSRADAARKFEVTEEFVKAAEAQGITRQWPPL